MRGEKLGARSEEAATHFLIEYRNSNVRHLFSHYQQMPPPWQHLNCYHKDSEGKMQEQEQEQEIEGEMEEAVEEEVEEKNSTEVRFND